VVDSTAAEAADSMAEVAVASTVAAVTAAATGKNA
jgi:hypothetical protein